VNLVEGKVSTAARLRELDTATIETICRTFEDRVEVLVARILERMRDELTEADVEAPEMWAMIGRLSCASRRSQAAHLARGAELPTTCPAPDVEAVAAAVQSGFSAETLLHSYRIAHTESLDAWLDCVDETPLEEGSQEACVMTISRYVAEYDDRVMRLVGEEFEREDSFRRGDLTRRRMRLVREVLIGSRDDLDEIGYDLTLEHLGVVAWGDGAEATLRELATATGRRLLSTMAEAGLLVGWLSHADPLTDEQRRAIRQVGRLTRVACGNPLRGLDGFRTTHRQAGDAYRVALRTEDHVTFYDDVALEALALRSEEIAQEFTRAELGSLDGDDPRFHELRDTLRAYYDASHNKSAAAATLGVHERTVARRLREIEELTGRHIDARRPELELALRVRTLAAP
jgi:hypothetical protein